MPKDFSLEGFQPASLPHLGTLAFIESWNDVPKRKSADEYPDSFKFLCLDENEKEVSRDKAKWCIPIVEFDVFSVDDNGKSVPFKEGSSIFDNGVWTRPSICPISVERAASPIASRSEVRRRKCRAARGYWRRFANCLVVER